MTKQQRPFEFSFHAGDVGDTVVIGSTSAGKSVPEELVKLWECGHSGGNISFAQAGVVNATNAKALRAAQQNRAPYYRRFDKRK